MTNLLKHKQALSVFVIFLVLLIAAIIGVRALSSQTKELHQLREQRKEMSILTDEFLSLREKIQTVERRRDLANIKGVLHAVDEIFSSVGLKDKLKTVKSSGRREIEEGIEEAADVLVEKVTMNEMVNLFYRIEQAPMILTVKKATVKQSFDDPELLNITLQLSFLKTK